MLWGPILLYMSCACALAVALGATSLGTSAAFAGDSTQIQLPVVGAFDWVHWAQTESMRHASSEPPRPAGYSTSAASAPAPAIVVPAAAGSKPTASDSDSPVRMSPTVSVRGLREPRFGGKLDARLPSETGLTVRELEDPEARGREMHIDLHRGPLKLEAAKSMRTQSRATTLSTEYVWKKTRLWSRYSTDARALGFGLSRPVADGFTLSTQWTASLQDHRVMVGIEARPSAAWKALRSLL